MRALNISFSLVFWVCAKFAFLFLFVKELTNFDTPEAVFVSLLIVFVPNILTVVKEQVENSASAHLATIAQLDDLLAQKNKKIEELLIFEEKTSELTIENIELEQKMIAATAELARLTSEKKDLTEQNVKNSEQIKNLTEQNQKLAEQIKNLTEQNVKNSEQNQKLAEQNQKLAEQMPFADNWEKTIAVCAAHGWSEEKFLTFVFKKNAKHNGLSALEHTIQVSNKRAAARQKNV